MKKSLERTERPKRVHKIPRIDNRDKLEPLHVRDCPWCHQYHVYMVRVSRVPVTGNTPVNEILKFNSRNQLIRYFICPNTGNRFRGILTLFHSPHEVIRNIEVLFVIRSKRYAS